MASSIGFLKIDAEPLYISIVIVSCQQCEHMADSVVDQHAFHIIMD